MFRTDNSVAGPVLRLALAAAMFPHGAQKAFGWFAGHGLYAWKGYVTGVLGYPEPVAYLIVAAELLGSVCLALGLLTRFCALAIAGVMAGAVYHVHRDAGFFMNWSGSLPAGSEGFEYHILAIGIALALVIRGAGAWSVDRRLMRAPPVL